MSIPPTGLRSPSEFGARAGQADLASPETAKGGPAFDEMLAAMLSRVGPPQLLGDEAGASEQVQSIEAPQSAEISDEHGLLVTVTEHGSGHTHARGNLTLSIHAAANRPVVHGREGKSHSEHVPAVVSDHQVQLAGSVVGDSREDVGAPRANVAATADLDRGNHSSSRLARHGKEMKPLLSETIGPSTSSGLAEAEGEAVEPPPTSESAAQIPEEFMQGGSAAGLQLIAQAAEGSVNVSARVDRLSREERMRLRQGIEQVLASHGFPAGEIRLNGAVDAVRRG